MGFISYSLHGTSGAWAGNIRSLKIIGYFLWISVKVTFEIWLTTGISLGPPIKMDVGVELDPEALLDATLTL